MTGAVRSGRWRGSLRLLWVGLSAGVLALLSYGAVQGWLGQRLEERVAARFQARAEIGSLALRPGALRLRDVVIKTPAPAAVARIEELSIHGPVLAIARGVSRSVERVQVVGLRVDGFPAQAVQPAGAAITGGREAAEPVSHEAAPGNLAERGSTQPPRTRVASAVAELADLLAAGVAVELDNVTWTAGADGPLLAAEELDVVEAARTLDSTSDLEVRVRGLRVGSALLAPEPIVVPAAGARVQVDWRDAPRSLAVRPSRLEIGALRLASGGELRYSGDEWRLGLDTTLPETPCAVVLGALPEAVLGAASGFAWSGDVAGTAWLEIDSARLEESRFELSLDERCLFDQVPESARPQRFAAPFEQRVIAADGSLLVHRTGPGTEIWTPIEEISPYLVHAVLEQEDDAFFDHQGFTPWMIEEALRHNLVEGEYVLGASTITMQLARNLFLSRDKNLARKVQESLFAWWLEESLTKRQILELYFNVVDYGPGIHGVREAARAYFGRRPNELRVAEAAFLSTVLTAPSVYHQQVAIDSVGERTAARVRALVRRMNASGRIDQAAMKRGVAGAAQLRFHRGDRLRPPSPAPTGWAAVFPERVGS